MADLQEDFEEALSEERLKAFHIAYKAGFRAAEFRGNEHRPMKDKVQPATDTEIMRSGEKALRSGSFMRCGCRQSGGRSRSLGRNAG